MKIGRRVLVVTSAGIVGAAWSLLLACSSSSTETPAVPTVDANHPATDSATPEGDSTPAAADTGAGDAGSDCGKAASLHPPTGDGGIYCPFSAVDGGKNLYCPTTDQCCESPNGGPASTCETKGSACPTAGSTVWECEDPSDCPTGMQCCAHGAAGATVTLGEDTCGPYLSKFQGTQCAATCAAGELVVCEEPSACASGTCTAVKPKANTIGVCH